MGYAQWWTGPKNMCCQKPKGDHPCCLMVSCLRGPTCHRASWHPGYVVRVRLGTLSIKVSQKFVPFLQWNQLLMQGPSKFCTFSGLGRAIWYGCGITYKDPFFFFYLQLWYDRETFLFIQGKLLAQLKTRTFLGLILGWGELANFLIPNCCKGVWRVIYFISQKYDIIIIMEFW